MQIKVLMIWMYRRLQWKGKKLCCLIFSNYLKIMKDEEKGRGFEEYSVRITATGDGRVY